MTSCLGDIMEKISSNDIELKKRRRYYLHAAICLLITFGTGFIPPVGSITPTGMQAIGIFVGMLYGWSTMEMLWPSLLGIVAIGLSGYTNMAGAFKSAVGDNLTLQIISVLLFAAYMEKSGLSLFISRWFASRKLSVGRPWVMSLMVLTSSFVLSVFTNGSAAIIISWSFFYKILESCNYTRKDAYTNVMLFGIVFAGLVGAVCLPYQVMSVIYLDALKTSTGIEMNPLVYFFSRSAISYILILIFWLICRFIIRPDTSKLLQAGDLFASMRDDKMTSEQKIAISAFIIFLLALFAPGNLPKSWPLVGVLGKLGLVGIATSIFIILSIVHVIRDGKSVALMNFSELMKTGMNWNLILCIAVTAPMANMLESDKTGVFNQFIAIFEPLTRSMGTLGFVFIVVLFVGILTQISHNTVLARVITPMLLPLAATIGINPIAMMMVIVLPIQVAVCTPGASGNAALIWSNTEWVQKKWVFSLCMLSFLLTLVYSLILLPVLLAIFN